MDKALQLTGLTQPELVSFVETLGEPIYRGRQLFAALQHRRLRSFDEMTDLPKELRARLRQVAHAATLKIESQYASTDGTRRYLMKTHDGLPVETVFIPEERRDTICFSSQSGCPLQCTFCLTEQLGLLRNLSAGEIVEQIIFALLFDESSKDVYFALLASGDVCGMASSSVPDFRYDWTCSSSISRMLSRNPQEANSARAVSFFDAVSRRICLAPMSRNFSIASIVICRPTPSWR